jgi:hypothetical protein
MAFFWEMIKIAKWKALKECSFRAFNNLAVNYFTLKVTYSFLASSESLSTELSSPAAITFNLEEKY